MYPASHAELIVYLPLLLILLGLAYAVAVDSFLSARIRRIMLVIVVLILSLVVQSYLDYLLDKRIALPLARILTGIYGYSVRPVILLLFLYIVGSKRIARAFWPLVGLNALIHLTALFSDVCFTISAANHFRRGPLGYSCHIVSGILLAVLLWATIREYSRVRRSEMMIPICNVLVIVAAVMLDSGLLSNLDAPISFLTIAVVVCTLFYYIWLHLQFVREHEQALQAEQRIQIMMTQIQPHFLYNTIATFKALCRKDPEQAAEVADKFGAYLRQNLDSLGMTGRIPFRQELEHTKLYSDIEMVRFENVRVEYDVAGEEFTVPPLILQPMVENAIRHGVRIRDEGLVRVTVRRGTNCHEIIVADNGTGFDPESIESLEGSHIGIRNVRERVQTMCGGSVEIDSRPGEGTTVTIRIPEEQEAAT
ncbi:MAG: histidine kinase [Oscillospiraceae bacterium]|nr:histidine kinase [Oscillospiraceae bacterium]